MENHEKFNKEELCFEVVLPSSILVNNNLDPSHIKLYAFVKGLTRLKGYCYASNAYLAYLTNCSERHVSRMLNQLSEEGFLEIDVDKRGIHWQRRIYLGSVLNKSLRKDVEVTPPDHESLPPMTPMSTDIRNIDNIEIDNKKSIAPKSLPRALHISTTEEDHKKLVEQIGLEKTEACYKRLSEWKEDTPRAKWKKNDYRSICRWVITAISESKEKPKAQEAIAQSIVEKLKKNHPNHPEITFGRDYIEFSNGMRCEHIKFTDHGNP
jgi:hypothetical protein